MKHVNVLGISGSPRKDGNTALLIRTIFKELNAKGINTELVQLSDVTIKGCMACGACVVNKHARCVMTDDYFNECFSKMLDADGIILGSPVYSAGVTAQIKALIDRAAIILAAHRGLFKYKVGAAVVAARRGGAISAMDTLNHFLQSKEMFLVGSTYWNMVYGKEIGEVEQDQEGMANMKNLGENMGWLLKKLHSPRL